MRSPFLWLALTLHVALATSYAWFTPTFEGPDENSHYEYAWHIANAGQLPLTFELVKERDLPQTEGAVLAHHPPLYYALVAAGMAAAGRDDTVFSPRLNPKFGIPSSAARRLRFLHEEQPDHLLNWLRMISVVLGAVTIACVHRMGRICCPDVPRVGDLAAMLTACLPMWSALHGLLNSDVLAATLSSATLLVLMQILRSRQVTTSKAALLGLLLGLAFLTKLTTLFLGGLAGLVALLVIGRWRQGWGAVCVAVTTTLLVCGWVYVRNYTLYNDPLALSAHDASFPPIPAHLRWHYMFGLDPWPASVPSFVPNVFTSLFGRFGWFSQPPHPALIWSGAGVAAIALVGFVRALFDRERKFIPHDTWLLLLACLLVLGGTFYFNMSAPQPQARLLFTAVAPTSVLLAAGLTRITTRLPRRQLVLTLLPITAILAFFTTFLPAFDPANARAPDDHRSLVGHIVAGTSAETIRWTSQLSDTPLDQPPTLEWIDEGAPPNTRYSLYGFDDDGRVWLASHEWTNGDLKISGRSMTIPEVAWSLLPHGVPINLRLRRVPNSPSETPRDLARTPGLRITRK
jgi:hypothetical protein